MLIQSIIDSSKYDIKCPYSMTPKGICVHNTANDASAKNEIAYMKSNDLEVSYHVAIDDIEAIQVIPFNRNAWHAGDGGNGNGNLNYIAIEICYSKSGGDKFFYAEKRAASEIALILKQYKWGIDKVKKHQDFSRKYCPHRTLDLGWSRFLNMIQIELNKLSTGSATTKSYLVRVNTDVLNVRSGPSINYKIVTTIKLNEVYTIIEEKNGWGKLKSGAGWICLFYTVKK